MRPSSSNVIGIHHILHKFKTELNVIRRQHIVLGVIDVFPKYSGIEQTSQWQCCGATVGPITCTIFIGLALSASKHFRLPVISVSVR